MKHEDQERIEQIKDLVRREYPNLSYHNSAHGFDVWNSAREYAIIANLPYNQRLALETAALLHDIIVVPERKDNGKKSAEFAGQYLPKLGFSNYVTNTASRLILATKMPQKPRSLLEGLICDCDLDNLGRENFFDWAEKLRVEWGKEKNQDWYRFELEFLQSHHYHTKYAKKMRNAGKLRNIELLKQRAGD